MLRRFSIPVVAVVAMVLVLLAAPNAGRAQSVGERLKEKTAQRLDAKLDETEDKVLDGFEGAIACVAGDKACLKRAKDKDKPVVLTDKQGKVLPPAQQPEDSPAREPRADATADKPAANAEPGAQGAAPAASTPPAGAWANFDFVPGNKVLFADDFARDRVGNFPQRLELVSGTLELVDWQGGRWVRGVSDGARFDVPLPQVLPARFTLEFDIAITEARVIYQNVHAASAKEDASAFAALDGGNIVDELPSSSIFISQWEAGVGGGNAPMAKKAFAGASGTNDESAKGKIFRVRLQADSKYVKVYVNEDRVANIPNGNFARTNKLRFSLNGSAEEPVYVGNIVVASGGTGMYDAIMASGRVATQGILFDVGSDRIRPESNATLRMIGDMLTEHPELKLTVEGHTDATGTAAANMTLSARRAQAIVTYLVTTHHVGAGRLTPQGMGQSKPVGSNDTPEGRQANRRVELVKM